MKTQFSKLVRFLCVLCALSSRTSAQTSTGLDIQLYAGLSITGAVDTVYSIQYVTDLAQPNAWRCLTFLQLPTSQYLWADTTAPATGRRFYRAVATVPTNLVFIPPGAFRMGSPTNELDRYDNETQHTVTLTKGFYIGKFPVTQEDYLGVVGSNPSYFNGVQNGTDYGTDLSRPVEQVTWYDATNYCAKRTQQEFAAGSIPAGSQYRLPTEAEWEYACRAWTSTRFYYGDDPDYADLTNYAWFGACCGGNSGGTTHPVGQLLPNLWGLYDMIGNVFEWCQDWYGPYPTGSVIDPQGPASGMYRVTRGCGWRPGENNCRSAGVRETDSTPDTVAPGFGFRVVLAPSQM